MKDLVVVGNGLAGVACVERILERRTDLDITIFGDEAHAPYNRALLPRFLAGGCMESDLTLKDFDWYCRNDISLRLGVRVVDVDMAYRIVTDSNSGETSFDQLLIATGASPVMPPIAGLRLPGVFKYCTLQEAKLLLAWVTPGCRVAVVGGGPQGEQVAATMRARGCQAFIADAGSGARICAVVGESRVEGLELHSGEFLPADAVLIATPMTPNADLGRRAGVSVERGIVVDDYMQTSHPDVYAVGECVEHRGVCYGPADPWLEQCDVLAASITGNRGPVYRGLVQPVEERAATSARGSH